MLIAQISDIHAFSDNDHLCRFDRLLTWLANLQPAGLVLTGDLTDGHWREGYKQIAARLDQQSYPSFVLPGNSDDRDLMRAEWGSKKWAHDSPDEALHFSYDAGDLRLIGLDSTVDAQAHGSVCEHVGWLEKQFNDADAAPALLFMHHHVVKSGIPTLDETICRGGDKLEKFIKDNPQRVLAVCSGHVHRPIAGTFAGIPAYICGSVCPANPVWFGTPNIPPVSDPPALMIHRFASNILTSHHVCV